VEQCEEEMTKLRDFEKVMKVINSCKTVDHFQATKRMINLYKKMHGNNTYSEDLDFYLYKKAHYI